jgi:hypothetical protein
MVLHAGDLHIGTLGNFSKGPAESVHEHHCGALTLGESFESRSEGWLKPGLGMLRACEEGTPQSLSGSTLAYSV